MSRQECRWQAPLQIYPSKLERSKFIKPINVAGLWSNERHHGKVIVSVLDGKCNLNDVFLVDSQLISIPVSSLSLRNMSNLLTGQTSHWFSTLDACSSLWSDSTSYSWCKVSKIHLLWANKARTPHDKVLEQINPLSFNSCNWPLKFSQISTCKPIRLRRNWSSSQEQFNGEHLSPWW